VWLPPVKKGTGVEVRTREAEKGKRLYLFKIVTDFTSHLTGPFLALFFTCSNQLFYPLSF
jgi:hypothetical protein